jgi:hypothetical protein
MEESDLNKLTLAMFSNKGMYKKHLERTDPDAHEKKCAYLSKIRKYRKRMLDLTSEFLQDPEKDFNTEVNEMFEKFSNTLVRYIQMKEMDEGDEPGCYETHAKNDVDDDGNDEDCNDRGDDENMNLFATSKTTKYYSKNRLANFFQKF